jgi:hypothetical protein
LYTYDAEHFEEQAIHIKKLYYKYKARIIAIDANGLGVGLVDFLTVRQVDPETGDELPAFGVEGGTSDEAIEQYKKIKGPEVEEGALYLIKANAPINTEAYTYVQTQISSGKIKFLIDEGQAKMKLMATKIGQNMEINERNERLQPFVYTTILKSQMLNLVQENDGVNIILKQSNKGIKKDKFSAFIYGLYCIKQMEDQKKKKKATSIADLIFFS